MAFKVPALVWENSVTTGTGAIALAGAVSGAYLRFGAALGVGDVVPYWIRNGTTGEYEFGVGTYSAADTLTRTTVLGGSNGTSAVNFTGGSKDVYVMPSFPADDSVLKLSAARGMIDGLTLVYNSATTLDVAAGVARDSTNARTLSRAASITGGILQAAGAWAAGSGQNKLDTGVRQASKCYHVFEILKDADSSTDWLFSLSASAPTMPAGYTLFRYNQCVLTDGSGNIRPFKQYGDEIILNASIAQVGATFAGAGSFDLQFDAGSMPDGVNVKAILSIAPGTGPYWLYEKNLTALATAATATGTTQAQGRFNVWVDTARTIQEACDRASGPDNIFVWGWMSLRGRGS